MAEQNPMLGSIPLAPQPTLDDPRMRSMFGDALNRHIARKFAPVAGQARLVLSHTPTVRYIRAPTPEQENPGAFSASAPWMSGGGPAEESVPVFDGESDSQAIQRYQNQLTAMQQSAELATASSTASALTFGMSRFATSGLDAQAAQTLGPQGMQHANIAGTATAFAIPGGGLPGMVAKHVFPRAMSSLAQGFATISSNPAFQRGINAAITGIESGSVPLSRTPFLDSLGQLFGRSALRKMSPQALANAQAAIKAVNGAVINGKLEVATSASEEAVAAAKDAFAALRLQAGVSTTLKLVRTAQVGAGTIAGGVTGTGFSIPSYLDPATYTTPEGGDKAVAETLKGFGSGGALGGGLVAGGLAAQGLYGRIMAPAEQGGSNIYANVRPQLRLLGGKGEVIDPVERPVPEPGPKLPAISTKHYEPVVVGLMEQPGAQVQAAARAARQTLLAQATPKEADRVRKGIDAALALSKNPPPTLSPDGATPMPPNPEAIEADQHALLQGIADLSGRDHTRTSKLIGFDYTPYLYGGQPALPGQLPVITNVARWAAGVLDEANRVGLKTDDMLATMPPSPVPGDPLFAAPRIKGIADMVLEQDPTAAVGPPDALFNVAPELKDQRPVRLEPQAAPPDLPETADVWNSIAAHAPSGHDFNLNPFAAARRQQFAAMTLSSWQPFTAGVLKAGNSAALYDSEPRVIQVNVDGEGRLMAEAQDPNNLFNTIQVDITQGTRPLGIPADAKWSFIPDRSAPVAFTLDPENEGLVIDVVETPKRDWQQDQWKALVAEDRSTVREDPYKYLTALLENPPQDNSSASAVLEQVAKLEQSHRTKAPTMEQVREEFGPGTPDHVLAYAHGNRLRQHAGVGAAIEAAKALASQRITMGTGEKAWTLGQFQAERGPRVLGGPEPALPGASGQELMGIVKDYGSVLDQGGHGPIQDAALRHGMDAELTEALKRGIKAHDPEEPAKRAAALLHMAGGEGFSKNSETKELFSYLTDEEKGKAMLAQLEDGRITSLKHLERLNPSRWAAKAPSYFAGWKPSPEQLTELRAAYNERLKRFRDQEKVKGLLSTRADESRTYERIPLEELGKIDPRDWDEMLAKDPKTFHAAAKQLFASFPDAKRTAAAIADETARQSALTQLEHLQDALVATTHGYVDEVMPYPNLKSPFNGLQHFWLGARSTYVWARTLLRGMESSFYRIGPGRQFPHPKDAVEAVNSGEWEKAPFQNASRAMLWWAEHDLDVKRQFSTLARAAEGNPKLDKQIFEALEFMYDGDILAKPEFTHNVRVGTENVTIKLSEWIPKLRAYYDRMLGLVRQAKIHEAETMEGFHWSSATQLEHAMVGLPEDSPEYQELHTAWEAANSEMLAAREKKAGWQNYTGVEGYISHIDSLLRDDIRAALENPYSIESRFISDTVKNRFMQRRKGDAMPFADWVHFFFLYNHAMGRQAYLEPALQRIRGTLDQLPPAQQDYMIAFMGSLKRQPTNDEAIINRALFEAQGHKLFTGGNSPMLDLAKKTGVISPQGGSRAHHTAMSAVATRVFNPISIAIQNISEMPFLIPNLGQNALEAATHGPWWAAKGAAKAAGSGVMEAGAFFLNKAYPDKVPLWYSEPTRAGVTSFFREMEADLPTSHVQRPASVEAALFPVKALLHTIRAVSTSTDFIARGTVYFTFYERAKRWFPNKDHHFWMLYARDETNAFFGSRTPVMRNAQRMDPLRQTIDLGFNFTINKLTRTGHSLAPLVGWWQWRSPQQLPKQARLQPPAGEKTGELDPSAWSAYQSFVEPPLAQGVGLPMGGWAAFKQASKLLYAVPTAAAIALTFYALAPVGLKNRLFEMTYPYNFGNFGQNIMLHWLPEMNTLVRGQIKKLMDHSDVASDNAMEKAKESLIYKDTGVLRMWMQAQEEKEELQKRFQRTITTGSPEPPQLPLPPGVRPGERVTHQGLFYKQIQQMLREVDERKRQAKEAVK